MGRSLFSQCIRYCLEDGDNGLPGFADQHKQEVDSKQYGEGLRKYSIPGSSSNISKIEEDMADADLHLCGSDVWIATTTKSLGQGLWRLDNDNIGKLSCGSEQLSFTVKHPEGCNFHCLRFLLMRFVTGISALAWSIKIHYNPPPTDMAWVTI